MSSIMAKTSIIFSLSFEACGKSSKDGLFIYATSPPMLNVIVLDYIIVWVSINFTLRSLVKAGAILVHILKLIQSAIRRSVIRNSCLESPWHPTLVWSRPFGGIPWVHHGVSYGYPMALSGLILGYPMGILGYPWVSYAIWLNQHFGSTIQS